MSTFETRQAAAMKSRRKGEMRMRVRGEEMTRMKMGNTTPTRPTITTDWVLIAECIWPSQSFILSLALPVL
jgi:hypothetical protein